MILKKNINESIINIDQLISFYYNATLDSFITIYNKIYNETEQINFEYSNIEEELNPIYYEVTPEDTLYKIKANIKELKTYAKFNFRMEYDKEKNIAKVLAEIINKSRPKNMVIDIFSEFWQLR